MSQKANNFEKSKKKFNFSRTVKNSTFLTECWSSYKLRGAYFLTIVALKLAPPNFDFQIYQSLIQFFGISTFKWTFYFECLLLQTCCAVVLRNAPCHAILWKGPSLCVAFTKRVSTLINLCFLNLLSWEALILPSQLSLPLVQLL